MNKYHFCNLCDHLCNCQPCHKENNSPKYPNFSKLIHMIIPQLSQQAWNDVPTAHKIVDRSKTDSLLHIVTTLSTQSNGEHKSY